MANLFPQLKTTLEVINGKIIVTEKPSISELQQVTSLANYYNYWITEIKEQDSKYEP